MKQTFEKTIEGHDLEFNRLLYPIRYNLVLKDDEFNGTEIILAKNEKGMWLSKDAQACPEWFEHIQRKFRGQ